MKAMSKGTVLSLVRHCTQGSLANVVMPENIASAVTYSTLASDNAILYKNLPSPKLERYADCTGNLTYPRGIWSSSSS